MPVRTTCALVALGLALSGSARAAVVYDNGAPDPSGGIEVTIRILAEDVLLPEPETITGVRLWAIADLDAWSGTIEYSLYESDGNVPAETPFASGEGANVRVAPNGANDRYTFGLEAPVELEAGTTYWLGLHMDDDFDDGTDCCVFWSTLPDGVEVGSSAASANAGLTSNWSLTPNHHAFQLLPEPGASALAAAALASLAALARLRRTRR